MTQGINFPAVYVADAIGVMLLGLILLIRGWSLPARKDESRILFYLVLATFINCLIDPLIFLADGKGGILNHLINLLGNSFLFLYNLIVGTGMLVLIVKHINKTISRVQYVIVWIIVIVETGALLLNFFIPIVFSLDETNTYHRGPGYYIFVVAAFFLIGFSMYVYYRARKKDGSLRFFPVWEFLIPIIVGVVAQTLYYGISMQPVCFAVAFSSIVVCLQNEYLYVDKLTGVYNRYELDKIRRYYLRRRDKKIAAIMLDMNDFKAINDNYSHNEGDQALIAMAEILAGVVRDAGNVIRFAGDEFVIILNAGDENTVPEYCRMIREALQVYNDASDKPYELSAAMGGSIFDIDDTTDIISRIDSLMYKDKQEYYKTHKRSRTGGFSEEKKSSES